MLVPSRQNSSGKDYQGFSRAYMCVGFMLNHIRILKDFFKVG
jgi:hypothetical protein